jgi:hypothetical protein
MAGDTSKATRAAGGIERAHRAVARVLLVVEGEHVASLERLRAAVDHAADLASLRYSGFRPSDTRRIEKTRHVLAERDTRRTSKATAKAAKAATRAEKRAARLEAAAAKHARKVAREDAAYARSLAKANRSTRKKTATAARERAELAERERAARALLEQAIDHRGAFDPYRIDPWSIDVEPCTGKRYEDFRSSATFKDAYDALAFRPDEHGRTHKPSSKRIRGELARMKRSDWQQELAGCAANLTGHIPVEYDDSVPF